MASSNKPDQSPQDLLQLATTRFGQLSEAEAKLLRAAPKGEPAACGQSRDSDDATNDPAKAELWGPERHVRAGLVRWLCTDREAASRVDPNGVRLLGATITGPLDLSFADVSFPLLLLRCRLSEQVLLLWTRLPALYLIGSRTGSIIADGLNVKGDVFLRAGFRSEGEVRLLGAQIGGSFSCIGGTFANPSGRALSADGSDVKGGILLRNGFQAQGEVRLLNAQIGGNLECDGGTFTNPSGSSLDADAIIVKGSVFLRNGFQAHGEVRLVGARVGGELVCEAGRFTNPSGRALSTDASDVKGGIFLRSGFQAEGEVGLLGAQVGGNLECDGSMFRNPSGTALSADGSDVRGDIFLRSAFQAQGEVRLVGARVGGSLDCAAGKFINPSGRALSADRINVSGYVFLRNGLHAEGEVLLLGAQIGANLECDGSMFTNPSGAALTADRINVKGSVSLSNAFKAEGTVRLLSAQIGGDLDCHGGTFSGLDAYTATIKGNLFWLDIKNPEGTTLDLRLASVGSIGDDNEKSWPKRGSLFLEGFVYGRVSAGATDAGTRLRWLARQDPFTPQPYRQLAKVLREEGDEGGAVTVLQEMERLRRKEEDHTAAARLESWILKESIGYGYNPGRAVWGIAGLSALAWIIYRRSYLAGSIVPTDKDAYQSFKRDGRPPADYEVFAPLIYSAENSLPLIRLGQADKWHPAPSSESALSCLSGWPTSLCRRCTWTWFRWLQRLLVLCGLVPDPRPENRLRPFQRLLIWLGLQRHANPEEKRSRLSRCFTSPRFLHWFLWIQILLAWLLATLFVAGVTGLVRRE